MRALLIVETAAERLAGWADRCDEGLPDNTLRALRPAPGDLFAGCGTTRTDRLRQMWTFFSAEMWHAVGDALINLLSVTDIPHRHLEGWRDEAPRGAHRVFRLPFSWS
jgi:hypothetical protein